MPVIDLDDLVTGRLEPFGGWRVFDPPPPQPEMAVEEFLQRPAIVGSDNDVDRRAAGRARIHLLADPGFVVAVQAVADFTPTGRAIVAEDIHDFGPVAERCHPARIDARWRRLGLVVVGAPTLGIERPPFGNVFAHLVGYFLAAGNV